MKKSIKELSGLFMAAMLIPAAFTGCGGSDNATSGSSENGGNSAAASQTSNAARGKGTYSLFSAQHRSGQHG